MNERKIGAEIMGIRIRSILLHGQIEMIKVNIKLGKLRLKTLKKEIKQKNKELKKLMKLGL